MRKIFTLCSVIYLFATVANAQTFAFYRNDAPVENNSEFTVSKISLDEFEDMSLESGLCLKNLTDQPVQTRVRQIVLVAPPSEDDGSLNFCFDVCMGGNTSQSQLRMVNANALMTPPIFHLSFYPFIYTIAKVQYEVYPESNPDDKISVTVTYDYNQNSSGLNMPQAARSIYVSQEGDRLQFHYSLNAGDIRLDIYDITGKKAAQYVLDAQKNTFSLPEKLEKGVYIYTIRTDNQAASAQKLLVQ